MADPKRIARIQRLERIKALESGMGTPASPTEDTRSMSDKLKNILYGGGSAPPQQAPRQNAPGEMEEYKKDLPGGIIRGVAMGMLPGSIPIQAAAMGLGGGVDAYRHGNSLADSAIAGGKEAAISAAVPLGLKGLSAAGKWGAGKLMNAATGVSAPASQGVRVAETGAWGSPSSMSETLGAEIPKAQSSVMSASENLAPAPVSQFTQKAQSIGDRFKGINGAEGEVDAVNKVIGDFSAPKDLSNSFASANVNDLKGQGVEYLTDAAGNNVRAKFVNGKMASTSPVGSASEATVAASSPMEEMMSGPDMARAKPAYDYMSRNRSGDVASGTRQQAQAAIADDLRSYMHQDPQVSEGLKQLQALTEAKNGVDNPSIDWFGALKDAGTGNFMRGASKFAPVASTPILSAASQATLAGSKGLNAISDPRFLNGLFSKRAPEDVK